MSIDVFALSCGLPELLAEVEAIPAGRKTP
jgi:hypothetical protein